MTFQYSFGGRGGSHREFDNGSRGEVSDEVDVQDLEELHGIVCRIFEAVYMFAKVIASFR